jgi:hypothetical protein
LRKNLESRVKSPVIKKKTKKPLKKPTLPYKKSSKYMNYKSEDAILNGYRVKIKFPVDLFIKKE